MDFDFRRKPEISIRGILVHWFFSALVFLGWIWATAIVVSWAIAVKLSVILAFPMVAIWFAELLSGYFFVGRDDSIGLNKAVDLAKVIRVIAWLVLVFLPIWCVYGVHGHGDGWETMLRNLRKL